MTPPRSLRDRIAAVIFGILVVVAAFGVTWMMRQGYAVHKLRRGVGDTWFLAADGTRWFRMDEHRRDVPLTEIPEDLRHAFIAVEDHRFYTHPGVDPIALGRAVVGTSRAPGTVEGGSTLTQQLARTLFLSNKKTYGRKAREAVLALIIDGQLSKDQILELYLNRIYLSAGVYGVETMSRHLFGRPAKQLNLAECALIAGLARAPSACRRGRISTARSSAAMSCWHACARKSSSPSRRSARRARRAFASGRIPAPPTHAAATRRNSCASSSASVSAAIIRPTGRCARRSCRTCRTRRSGRSRRAAPIQRARAAGGAGGDRSAHRRPAGARRRPRLPQSQFNRASRSRRQPGSAFKPFLYAAALEHGYSPVSLIDGLTNIAPQGPDEWAPRNADGQTPDVLTLRAALLESNNRAATALQQRVGSRPVLRLASHVGLHDLPDVPSLSLGTGLVTPLDLTAAYAAFPNGGLAVAPRAILRVVDADGDVALDNPVVRSVSSPCRPRIRWSRC